MNDGSELHLGVNIDHVATLRQVRGTRYPEPARAVQLAEKAGADSITVHLREDRRHIQDHDLQAIRQVMTTRMNLEMAVTNEMAAIATRLSPSDCCLVPEKREELTTEGGLDVVSQGSKVGRMVGQLTDAGIRVSLFIDPDRHQLDAAVAAGAPVVELHTGAYADSTGVRQRQELERIRDSVSYGLQIGLIVHAGHGLNYDNVDEIAAIPGIRELNIGHSIVARAVFDGMATAVREMKRLMSAARSRN